MHILTNDSHESFFNMLKSRALEAMSDIDRKLDSLQNRENWEKLKSELFDEYISAYPGELFEDRKPIDARKVSEFEFNRYRVENYLFESIPGWYVNATLYLPKEKGRYPGIVCPTGHSSKTLPNYTGSAQLFAVSGYAAVSFDPPGMRGEHIFGNDHFEDGARGFLSGFWSQTFFVADAIRCLDFLESREDIIKDRGFGMTGISGGGTTSMHTAVLDDRVSCFAPVCCISDEIDKIFNKRYTFCPEGRGYRHIAAGIKERSILSLSAPKPCLVCAGTKDEVFDVSMTEKTIQSVSEIYKFHDSGEIGLFTDPEAGHEYSLPMINEVAAFFDRNLKGLDNAGRYNYGAGDIEYPEAEKILCRPDDTSSMYTVNLERFRKSERQGISDIDEIASLTGVEKDKIPLSVLKTGDGWMLWAHRLCKLIYAVDEYFDVPALLLEREGNPSKSLVIYADDEDKWGKMENDGFLTQKSGFLSRTPVEGESSIISIDVTGVGELKSEPFPFDLSAWGRADRLESYVAMALGTSVLSTQVEQMLAVLNHEFGTRSENITFAAKGISAVPALIASAIFGKCGKVVLENLPVSFESMAESVPNRFCPGEILYNAPEKYEIYEIARKTDGLKLVNPIFADGKSAPEEIVRELFGDNVEIEYSKSGLTSDLI